ncbi:protein NipSnap homolog 3B isoform X2 [Zootoca vivipara]|uniref:protein NipSnap homolog 3B isoform X2 n=1 Tax=Zootoca vivipara TaxID=8524 RepID=UPI0015912788|nr:protein NipSnap homolog 3B isoform X2 [Zootoca vivipara]
MLASRALFGRVAVAARRATAEVSSPFSTGPRQDDGTFYEFRTYTVKPDKMKDFLELTSKNIHLRTAHSQMVGYWTSEFGGLNKAFHIWKYESFAQRSAVRTALAKDQEWQEKYMSRMLPLLNKQDNEIAYLVPWCELGSPPKDGVYELVTFQMKPGGPAVWGQSFKAAVGTHIKTGHTELIGVFHTEYGLLNRVHVLWWNENSDSRAAGRHSAHEDPRVVASVRESVQFLESQQNCLLVPTAFSPLK